MGVQTRRLGLAVVLAAALAGCAGTAGTADGTAAIGAAGGTVTEAGGASVVVPAGAFEAETTLRIAKDATGAPALPAGLTAAGDTYVITPHGGSFAQPVEVRIPAPALSLQPNEELKLAKAQPGGEWVILGDSVLAEGVLSAQVSSFSFFVALRGSYPLPVLQAPTFSVTTSLTCVHQPCEAVVGSVIANLSVATNGGQVPRDCQKPVLVVVSRGLRGGAPYSLPRETVSIDGGLATIFGDPGPAGISQEIRISVELACLSGPGRRLGPEQVIRWRPFPAYPALAVAGSPAGLDVVEGLEAQVRAVLLGGAVQLDARGGRPLLPTPANRAIIDWERSDDAGTSWRTIARSYQDEANPTPDPTQSTPWALWGVSHGFIASASDRGALLRVRACYTPPDVPAPPCVTGPITQVNVLQQSALPAFTSVPRSVLVTAGQPATFTATAGGAPAPALRWQTRAANDAGAWSDATGGTGATTGAYTTAALSLADNGRQYRAVATNAAGSVESPAVTASVSDADVAPTITTQPAGLSVTTGSDAAFAVVARGTEALAYQWRKDGTPIAGATGPVLRLSAVGADSAGAYSVLVSNLAGAAASDTAALTVSPGTPALAAPVIVTQPTSIAVGEGSDATFAVGVSGGGLLAFQWSKDGVPIAGATAAALTLPGVTPAHQGNYGVLVTNAAGSATSGSASLEVSPAPAPPDVTPPTITTQPATLVVLPGGGATLAVAVTGAGPLSYQWTHGDSFVVGGTGPVLHLPSVGPADAGDYAVVVTNVFGTAFSDTAQIILVGAPGIITQPADASVVEGSSATFTVAATGAGLGYQWLRNGLVVPGATGPTHTTPATTLAESGALYAVLVYSGAGLVQSQPAVLTVTAPPVVAGPPRATLAAGPQHTCAIRADASLACWGEGGQLGTGDSTRWSTPFTVPLAGAVSAVAAGGAGGCAIHGPGDLSCWGGGSSLAPVLVAGHTGVLAVSVGTSHRCFATAGGAVYCWGSNSLGELGDGTTTGSTVPVRALGAGNAPVSGVVALSAGFHSTCALKADGTVLCWGGAIGSSASPIGGLTGVTALAQGELRPCALSSDQLVRCWSGTGTPAVVAGLTGVTALASGQQHSCAAREDGSVWCWGTGLMGNGNVSETQPTPQRVVGLSGVGAAAAGWQHTCALRAAGTLTCWGANTVGQLGTGDTAPRTTPTDLADGAIWMGP
ncbi:MAG: hypothetical protein IPO09_16525 [Anaeromyxobacter sp.]|nr:hypothetical protein [Anaeromyxobacter sp.]MBL0276037.1 hypothetical protein [Anaeromyxobacter sp.]